MATALTVKRSSRHYHPVQLHISLVGHIYIKSRERLFHLVAGSSPGTLLHPMNLIVSKFLAIGMRLQESIEQRTPRGAER